MSIFAKFLVKDFFKDIRSQMKGAIGESAISFLNENFQCGSGESCYKLNNILLPIENGTTQIDHLLLFPNGIFVIETKNINGWIFGGEQQKEWTVMSFGNKFKIQNPLQQNMYHVKKLAHFLQLEPHYFFSVIVFVGNSEFKTPLPDNVKKGIGYVDYILNKQQKILTNEQIERAYQKIQLARLENTVENDEKHVQSIKQRHEDNANKAHLICPQCGAKLALRTAKKGAFAGQNFYGCTAYPRCRYVQNINN